MTALPVVETKQGKIFKQERLAPLPIEFQLAWMLAFNDGLLRDHYLFTTYTKYFMYPWWPRTSSACNTWKARYATWTETWESLQRRDNQLLQEKLPRR